MKDKINIAIIGLGGRGSGMSELMAKMDDVNVVAVCDKYPDRAENGAKRIKACSDSDPVFTTDYHEILDRNDIDSVYIATDWECHIQIAIEAMKKGIPAAFEVGGAYSLDDCWELVDTYEKTGTWGMIMENCCYGEREMMVKNMVRKGLLGDIIFCSGQYAHDLRNEICYGEKNRHYRLRNYIARNCENYPTHELGPIAEILNINRGNRFVSLESVCTKATGLKRYVKNHEDLIPSLGETEFAQSDIVKTFIKTEKGELIELTLDTCLPRFYSRGFTVRGEKGLYQEDGDIVYLEGVKMESEWDQDELWGNVKNFLDYNSDLWKNTTKEMLEAGHGGMDWFVVRAWITAVKEKTLPPIDVYDAASWMAVTPLSEMSLKNNGELLEFPDFTRGKYVDRNPETNPVYDLK